MLHKLLSAIPKEWKKNISQIKMDPNAHEDVFMFHIGKNLNHISSLATKQIYQLLMRMGTTENEPICVKLWQANLNKSMCHSKWNKIFNYKIKNRIDNKLGHFQFNLLYNLIPCKKNLFKWKLSESDKCSFCNAIDDYNHFFVTCNKNIYFWEDLRKCL